MFFAGLVVDSGKMSESALSRVRVQSLLSESESFGTTTLLECYSNVALFYMVYQFTRILH